VVLLAELTVGFRASMSTSLHSRLKLPQCRGLGWHPFRCDTLGQLARRALVRSQPRSGLHRGHV